MGKYITMWEATWKINSFLQSFTEDSVLSLKAVVVRGTGGSFRRLSHPPSHCNTCYCHFCVPPCSFNRWINFDRCRSFNPSFLSPSIEAVKEIVRILLASTQIALKICPDSEKFCFVPPEAAARWDRLWHSSFKWDKQRANLAIQPDLTFPRINQHCNPGSHTLRGRAPAAILAVLLRSVCGGKSKEGKVDCPYTEHHTFLHGCEKCISLSAIF